jgi:hypothetical protein
MEKGYLVTVSSLASRIALINYFLEFPLLSSKHHDYLNWVKAHELVTNKQYRTIEGSVKLLELKSTMNNKRTSFNWEHLDNFFF